MLIWPVEVELWTKMLLWQMDKATEIILPLKVPIIPQLIYHHSCRKRKPSVRISVYSLLWFPCVCLKRPWVWFLTHSAGPITTQRRVLNQSRRTGSLSMNSVRLLYMADGGTIEGKKTPLSTAVPSLIKCKTEHLKEVKAWMQTEPWRVLT